MGLSGKPQSCPHIPAPMDVAVAVFGRLDTHDEGTRDMDEQARHALAGQLAELLVLLEPSDPFSVEALVATLQLAKDAGEAMGSSELTRGAADAAGLLSRIAAGGVPDTNGALGILGDAIDELRSLLSGSGSPAPRSAEDLELLHEFVSRALEYLDAADEQLLALDQDRNDRELLDSVFRAFHTIKGMTGFLSLDEIQAIAHEGESGLAAARSGERNVDDELLAGAFRSVDILRTATKALLTDIPEAAKPLARRGSAAASERSGGGPSSPTTSGGSPQQKKARPVAAASVRETVRVDAARLDQLLDAIGELMIAESMATRSVRVETNASRELEQQLRRLDKLTRQLHEMAGSLRMVPMRPVFQRMARATRDVSSKSGKAVRLVTSGADTELDRAVVDKIADPLLHLVRNAVDHGIEASADEREAAGKSRSGRVELRAFHRAGSIYVEVEDDGAGLDRDQILAKGKTLGLVREDATPSDRELYNLLFLPGFSTSDVVTDVSGRGVGMDVVKRTVDALSGQVTVRSEQGKGTTFSIRLPVTLAVIDGMAVRVAEERYIVPTLSVVRSVRPEPDAVTRVLGSGEVLEHGDELLRLIRLGELFDVKSERIDASDSIVMVVEDEGARAGLLIDEILGQQQIVIKSLGDRLDDVAGISGGAVMPDGQVGLILDVEGLVRLANEN